MAIALRRIRDRIISRLRDSDAKRGTFSIVEYDQAIADAYLWMQGMLPPAELYTANAVTITAGTDTFTLPTTVAQYTGNDGGAEYAGDVRLQLNSTKRFLTRVTTEELHAMVNRLNDIVLGIPQYFALWEENDQDVQGRVFPGTKLGETCNLYRTLMADDVRDFVGSGTDNLDGAEILLSRQAANALVYYAAAEMLMAMPEEELKTRNLDRGVASLWLRRADEACYQESARRHDLDSVGRQQRWTA